MQPLPPLPSFAPRIPTHPSEPFSVLSFSTQRFLKLSCFFFFLQVLYIYIFFLIQWSSGLESGEWHQSLMMNIPSVPWVPLFVSEWLVWCLRGLFNGTSNLEPLEGGTSHTHKQRGRRALVLMKTLAECQPITVSPRCDTGTEMTYWDTKFKLQPLFLKIKHKGER